MCPLQGVILADAAPTFFINGALISGTNDFEDLSEAINAALEAYDDCKI